ncbi:MAG: ribulokinase [Spirochaetales bacterium]|nr:ribulokinase [Spirochaetales bacterium]
MKDQCVIGVDFGTDSVRSVIINSSDGSEISSSVCYYSRWKKGDYCDSGKNQFRQHPLDYIEGMESSIKQALASAPAGIAGAIKGISVDTTGSTPVAVDKTGIPLSMNIPFTNDPDAMFILWKDHTAVAEAAEINELAHSGTYEDYTKYVGGVYSSEWFWAKLLHIIRKNKSVREHAFSWVEHCDWVSAMLTGNTNPLTIKRSRCAAGHKAMWHPSFGGLPRKEFLEHLDPLLKGIRGRLFDHTFTSDVPMGTLSSEWASRLGLSPDVVIGVGAFDAHMGAVGAEIEPYILSKVMGTSTCDMLIAPNKEIGDKLIAGICGQVDGSIIPGMMGMEAGQSAFGDVYAWFADVLAWSARCLVLDDNTGRKIEGEKLSAYIIKELSREAEILIPSEQSIVSLDWMNGRRTPYANQELKGALLELNLGSSAAKIFRGLVEGTAFGAKKIVDCFQTQGVPIKGVIALGGVAKKSPFVMQIVADVLGIPIRVAKSDQACALGAAMFAATASGIYKKVEDARNKMGNGFETTYTPNRERAGIYNKLYKKYEQAGSFVEQALHS